MFQSKYFNSSFQYKVLPLLISRVRRPEATPILGRFIRTSSLKRVNFPILDIWSAAQRDREEPSISDYCAKWANFVYRERLLENQTAKWMNSERSPKSTKPPFIQMLQLSVVTISFFAWGRRNQGTKEPRRLIGDNMRQARHGMTSWEATQLPSLSN